MIVGARSFSDSLSIHAMPLPLNIPQPFAIELEFELELEVTPRARARSDPRHAVELNVSLNGMAQFMMIEKLYTSRRTQHGNSREIETGNLIYGRRGEGVLVDPDPARGEKNEGGSGAEVNGEIPAAASGDHVIGEGEDEGSAVVALAAGPPGENSDRPRRLVPLLDPWPLSGVMGRPPAEEKDEEDAEGAAAALAPEAPTAVSSSTPDRSSSFSTAKCTSCLRCFLCGSSSSSWGGEDVADSPRSDTGEEEGAIGRCSEASLRFRPERDAGVMSPPRLPPSACPFDASEIGAGKGAVEADAAASGIPTAASARCCWCCDCSCCCAGSVLIVVVGTERTIGPKSSAAASALNSDSPGGGKGTRGRHPSTLPGCCACNRSSRSNCSRALQAMSAAKSPESPSSLQTTREKSSGMQCGFEGSHNTW